MRCLYKQNSLELKNTFPPETEVDKLLKTMQLEQKTTYIIISFEFCSTLRKKQVKKDQILKDITRPLFSVLLKTVSLLSRYSI